MDPFVRDAIGPYEKVSDFAHGHGYSQLERVRAGERIFWVKRHANAGKQAGEIHALRFWGPTLGRVPNLVAWRTDPAVIVISEIEGVAPDAEDPRLWREGGEWLVRMHAIENAWLGAPGVDGQPQGEPEYDAESHFLKAIQTRIRDGRDAGWLSAPEVAFVEQEAPRRMAALAGDRPRAIHRDYGPRNWIAVSGGGLAGVIDFEHAVWGSRAMDLGRLGIYSLDERPDLEIAFYEGYGPVPDDLRAQIEAGKLLHAVAGLVFAHRVADEAFVRLNRAALGRLMRGRRS